jgi:polyisoprenoid-binding protein YceI
MRHVLALTLTAMLGGAAIAADEFTLTGENTKIEFIGSKPEGKHNGGFKTLEGTASAERIEVTIDTASIYSDDRKLTAHLKSPDFFDVKTNPKAKFVTTQIAKGSDGYTVTGDLTLNGKTKAISFPAKISTEGGYKLNAEFTIDRTQFGMTYGKGKIHDDVKLTVAVSAK